VTKEEYGAAYEKYFRYTVSFLLSIGVRGDDAEDLAQRAWMRGLERLHQLRNPKRVEHWINSIAYNFRIMDIRKAHPEEEYDETRDPRRKLADGEAAASVDVQKILRLCSPEDRKLLVLLHIQGCRYREISESFNINRITLRVRMRRVSKKVLKALEASRQRKELRALVQC
jgi:RNA polymerase sigma-70 factor (ECF subfamily)